MKGMFLVFMACLACTGLSHAQEPAPSLVIYINPDEYDHEVRLGVLPYYVVWARKGPALEQAAKKAFQPHFGEVAMCEGSNSADVVVWLKPHLAYSAPMQTYYAKVTARFYSSDGKFAGKLHSTGTYPGSIGSDLTQNQVQQAFDAAMQDVASQYAADSGLQQAVDRNAVKSPCAMVALLPRK